MDVVSDTLPSKIEGTFDIPKVFEMVQAVGRDTVEQFIAFELVNLAALVSVGGNITPAQRRFIASELINIFPNETIADFKLCFQRGARGDYGDIFRMDGIIIRKWMEAYLEEKYKIAEDLLMKEKDNDYTRYTPDNREKIGHAPILNGLPAPPDVAQKYIDEMKGNFSPDKKVRPITEDEIQEEGRQKPKETVYKPPTFKDLVARHRERLAFYEQKYREDNPNCTDEEVAKFLSEASFLNKSKPKSKPKSKS